MWNNFCFPREQLSRGLVGPIISTPPMPRGKLGAGIIAMSRENVGRSISEGSVNRPSTSQ